MARHNIKDSVKKERTWKFYSILSSIIGVCLIGIIIGVILIYNAVYSDDYDNKFSQYTDYKLNYNEIEKLFSDKYIDQRGKYTIIFAYDESYMTQSEIDELDDDDPSRKQYINTNKALSYLWETIELNNKYFGKLKETDETRIGGYVEMYFINTSLLTNSDFLSSKYAGGSSSDEDDSSSSVPAVFVLDDEGNYISTFEEYYNKNGNKNEYTISSNGTYKSLESDLNEIKELVLGLNEYYDLESMKNEEEQ